MLHQVVKQFFIFLFLIISFYPLSITQAKSDLSTIWTEQSYSKQHIEFFVNWKEIGDLLLFLLYLFLIISGAWGIILIFIGGVKMYLNEVNLDISSNAEHIMIVGLISFLISTGLLFSIPKVIILVKVLTFNLV